MKHIALIASVLLVSVGAFAQNYSNASLNGNYSVQFSTPYLATWSKTFSCPSNPSITLTVFGETTTTEVVSGVATLDGNGNLTFTGTDIGQFDVTATSSTVQVTFDSSCKVVSTDSGHIVYQAGSALSQTGTYAVQPDGSGTLSVPIATGPIVFRLAGTDTSTGLSSTILMNNSAVDGHNIGTGVAVRQ